MSITLSSPIAGCMRWGKWGANFSTAEFQNMVNLCLEYGITSFDHADIYGDYTTEEEFGRIILDTPSIRHQIQLISKAGIQLVTTNKPEHEIKSYNTTAKHLIQSAENSLKNFRTDYLDVFLIHRPSPLLNPNEIAIAITHLREKGKIKSFGVSNFLPAQVNALHKFVAIEYNQLEISIINFKNALNGCLDNCLENNIIPMAWAPLGGGLITDETHEKYRSIQAIALSLAQKYNSGINEILIAFLLKHPTNIIPVVGTTKIERLSQAKKANLIKLSDEDWFKLLKANQGEEVE